MKNPDYNIANFDAIKLPELEVCFYTPRSGGVAGCPCGLREKSLTRVASVCHTTNESSILQLLLGCYSASIVERNGHVEENVKQSNHAIYRLPSSAIAEALSNVDICARQ